MSEEINPREELYRRFRESLSHPVSERFFDEDELIEIYDYAGDLADDYVQMEALFCGARLYPESQGLAERRALLYLDTSIDDSDEPSPAAGEFLADHADTASPLFDIVRLQTKRPADDKASEEALAYLLEQYSSFNDEEMVRLVNLASDLCGIGWLRDHFEELRSKTDNPPILLYEALREADESTEYEFAEKLAEELIENEPFAVPYWQMLFRAQARAGKEEEAKSTFDYARALATDDSEALLSLAGDVYNFAPFLYKEAYEMLDTLIEENPDRFAYVDCQCALLIRSNVVDGAVNKLIHFIETHPDNAMAMRQLMMCNILDPKPYLGLFYTATGGVGFNPELFSEIVSTLSMNSAINSLNALWVFAPNHAEIDPSEYSAFVEALFAARKYAEVVEMIESYPLARALFSLPLKGSANSYAYIVSLLKLRRRKDALAHIAEMTPYWQSMMHDAPMPVRMAVRMLFTLEDKMRRHPESEELYWEVFDMLGYSKF